MNKVDSTPLAGRLASLDILRGLDLFMLVFFRPVFMKLAQALYLSQISNIQSQISSNKMPILLLDDIFDKLSCFRISGFSNFHFDETMWKIIFISEID